MWIPVFSQILPSRIEAPNQPELLFPAPVLQLLLTYDRALHAFETFPIHESDRVVIVREAFEAVRFVLEHAAMEVVCHANVESAAGTALEDVDVEAVLARHAATIVRFTGVCSAIDHSAIVMIPQERKVPRLALSRFAPARGARDDKV